MDFILNPFITLLVLLYSIFNRDMVLAIIVFTAIVRLLVYPLTAQQMKSTTAMQKVAPELKKLQEKHKGDREKLAQEQMRLYRENNINPVGGCLPLLIQFPILIALYQSILYALASTPLQLMELSGRLIIPGMSSVIPLENRWLGLNLALPPDISIAPVIAVALPLLVVITTWIQFKVTVPSAPPNVNADGRPDQAQAMQQSMGTIMPIMYGFFALSFSIGLSIYFVASNVITIVQYALTGKADFRRIFSTRKPATPAVKIEGGTAGAVVTPKPVKASGSASTMRKATSSKSKRSK